ncbi:hypothetical protein DFQ01_103196 [Paenibacillus cellulosilyticus]|uniref:Uncharacterized protein n=1 Tax=Paenibacillus cellulosilyticus TaxID=375489 RepID=A0A2V2YXF1_9BACL|nr:hypothetical protein [Paenibacillus cellulosilyticus]PWW06294.1 hypothetical protein DFQ01_103196 [Paenibacillus cellulosilyticus]QKS42959.1 hypothetical protein HUB94_00215 [Paenibacillus cellulosilyticus]QKS43482.1 hypothetical protein HUB94_02880 [Paenibacillus cellulosilyticus]
MLASRQKIYLACEDMNFAWDEVEVRKFHELWKAGVGIFDIAEQLKRDPDEVALLIIDRSRQHRIQPRTGGIWGEEYFEIRKYIESQKDKGKPRRRKGSGASKATVSDVEGIEASEAR